MTVTNFQLKSRDLYQEVLLVTVILLALIDLESGKFCLFLGVFSFFLIFFSFSWCFFLLLFPDIFFFFSVVTLFDLLPFISRTVY